MTDIKALQKELVELAWSAQDFFDEPYGLELADVVEFMNDLDNKFYELMDKAGGGQDVLFDDPVGDIYFGEIEETVDSLEDIAQAKNATGFDMSKSTGKL